MTSPQTDLFGDHDPAPQNPERMQSLVRPRLAALLAEARAAQRIPWDAQATLVNRTLFHQMANWLPEPERDRLRADFLAELARLSAN